VLQFAGLLGLALSWAVGSFIARPVNAAVAPPPAPAVPVHVVTRDGVAIAGSYWPGTRPDGPAVLLLHGINNTRRLFYSKAHWLNGLGYGVLAIDLRGHGESGAVERTFGWREAEDAEAALRWLRLRYPHRKVGVIGVSLGGAAALLGRDGPLRADAMVLHAVYPDIRTAIANRMARFVGRPVALIGEPLLSEQARLRYGVAPERIAPIEGLRRYAGPVLIIGGAADANTTPADSRAMYAAAPGPKALWMVGGADHVAASNLWSDEYRVRVGALFARTLGTPVPRTPMKATPPAPHRYGPDA
jgi:pimeloyl-ACP methyl ester carboxylesterase